MLHVWVGWQYHGLIVGNCRPRVSVINAPKTHITECVVLPWIGGAGGEESEATSRESEATSRTQRKKTHRFQDGYKVSSEPERYVVQVYVLCSENAIYYTSNLNEVYYHHAQFRAELLCHALHANLKMCSFVAHA